MLHPYTEALLRSIPKVEDPSHTRLRVITGRPPDLTDPPPGCKFAPRCPYVQERCRVEEPTLRSPARRGHRFACHFPLGTEENAAGLEAQHRRRAAAGRRPARFRGRQRDRPQRPARRRDTVNEALDQLERPFEDTGRGTPQQTTCRRARWGTRRVMPAMTVNERAARCGALSGRTTDPVDAPTRRIRGPADCTGGIVPSHRRYRGAKALAALSVTALVAVASCGDDDDDAAAPTTTPGTVAHRLDAEHRGGGRHDDDARATRRRRPRRSRRRPTPDRRRPTARRREHAAR